jgi:hypothetical protein
MDVGEDWAARSCRVEQYNIVHTKVYWRKRGVERRLKAYRPAPRPGEYKDAGINKALNRRVNNAEQGWGR